MTTQEIMERVGCGRGIAVAAAEVGVLPVLMARRGQGDATLSLYYVGDVRVIDTNGDPVWEESDPDAFAELWD